MWILSMTIISSIDCLFAGVAYGARGIRIPFLSKLILFLMAFIVGTVTQVLSTFIAGFIPPSAAEIIGQCILLALGLFMLMTAIFDKKKPVSTEIKTAIDSKEPKTLFRLVLKSVGITVQILKNYEDADINDSGKLDPMESLFLSIALTLDCTGLILCGSLIGEGNILLPLALSLGQVVGLVFGAKLGKLLFSKVQHPFVKFLPSILLILTALFEFIR